MNKSFSFFFLIITLSLTSSCLKDKNEERTEETERIEISNLLLDMKNAGNVIDTTSSGMYYVVYKAGNGFLPQVGDTCYVEYFGSFIDGVIFESSQSIYPEGIREIIYKETELLDGFEEAISLMKKGTEATFIIPSKLALGSTWHDFIPPFTTVIYSIKMHDLKPKITE